MLLALRSEAGAAPYPHAGARGSATALTGTGTFGLLGPLEVRRGDGTLVDVGGRQPRVVLGALLAARGRAVTVAALVDALWGAAPPPSAAGTLQSYVSRLRRPLIDLGAALTLDDAGYRLAVAPGSLDVERFESLADEGRALLDAGDVPGARARLLEAEALWRGPALVDLLDVEGASASAVRLEERRLLAVEDRVRADLALGRHVEVATELAGLVAAHPLRESLAAHLAVALYRSSRQADALRALAATATALRDGLGLEPGPEVRDLEAAILRHDPSLDLPAATAHPPAAAATTAPIPSRPAPGVVGRDVELAELVAALDDAADGARFVVIEGEPGIGKTHLAEELRRIAAARGSLTAWGRSDEGGAAPALWSWLPPLRAVVDRLGAAPPAVRELLAGGTPLQAGQGGAMRFERFEAVAALLEQAGTATPGAPLVVLLDDLQWADATSLELLTYLTGRLDRGVLVVSTVRPLEVGRIDGVTDALAAIARHPASRRLTLRGLDARGTAALLRDAEVPDLPAAALAAVHERAEGNPFYAIELARLADEHGDLGEVPANVGDVIRRRLARLPEPTAELLGVAAVLGRDVDLQLLARVADPAGPDAYDAIEPAVAHRLLVDAPGRPGTLRFTHALVREVLLDGLTSLRRARLHLRVADAIEAGGTGTDDAEILAEHLWQAAPVGGGARAAAALERAAEVAVSRISYGAAERHLGRAVQLHRASGAGESALRDELRAIFRLMEVTNATRNAAGADVAVLARGKELADRLGEDEIGIKLLFLDGAATVSGARMADVEPLSQVYLARTIDDPRDLVRASGLLAYGIGQWIQGNITTANEYLQQAAPLFGATVPDDAFVAEQMLNAVLFDLIVQALAGTRAEDETFGTFDLLLASVPPVAVPPVCSLALFTTYLLDRDDLAVGYDARARTADPASEFAFWGGQLLAHHGIARIRAGELDAGLATFADGWRRYTDVGGRSGVAMLLAVRAEAVAALGEADLAVALLAEAWAEHHDCGEGWALPQLHIAAARVASAAGDEDGAAEHLRVAVEVARSQGSQGLVDRARRTAATFGRVPPPSS